MFTPALPLASFRFPPRYRRTMLTAACLAACGVTNAASAANWAVPGAGDWFLAANWSPAAVPSDFTLVDISNAGTAEISGGLAKSSTLYLGNFTGQSGHLSILGGTYQATGTVYVGNSGSGRIEQSDGTFIPSSSGLGFFLGYNSGVSGTYVLNGGTLVAPKGRVLS